MAVTASRSAQGLFARESYISCRVGWVERSETHHPPFRKSADMRSWSGKFAGDAGESEAMGFAALYPSYVPSSIYVSSVH